MGAENLSTIGMVLWITGLASVPTQIVLTATGRRRHGLIVGLIGATLGALGFTTIGMLVEYAFESAEPLVVDTWDEASRFLVLGMLIAFFFFQWLPWTIHIVAESIANRRAAQHATGTTP